MRKSTSPYAASSPTSRQGRNRTSGAPPTLPPQSAATEEPPALPPGDPFTPAQGNVLPQIRQNNNPPVVPEPRVLFQVELNNHIHYLTFYPQLMVIICPQLSLISVSHCLGIYVAQPMNEEFLEKDYIHLFRLIQPYPDTNRNLPF